MNAVLPRAWVLAVAALAACAHGGRPRTDAGSADERAAVKARAAAAEPAPAAEPPAPQNPHVQHPVPSPGSLAAPCLDRELSRRGLNAFGDPLDIHYPEGPPKLASEVERQKMLLERYPELAEACRAPP